jgi:hypothetical protein
MVDKEWAAFSIHGTSTHGLNIVVLHFLKPSTTVASSSEKYRQKEILSYESRQKSEDYTVLYSNFCIFIFHERVMLLRIGVTHLEYIPQPLACLI